MRNRHHFRPSQTYVLEERVALSTIAALADVSSAATTTQHRQLTFQGNFVTVPPRGIGGGDTTSLGGSARFPGVGPIRLVGALQSNPSVAPPFQGIQGAVTITVPRQPGSAVLLIRGPVGDLSPEVRSTLPVSFRVLSATGVFASFANAHGNGLLLLRSRPVGSPGGLISGRFSLGLVLS